MLRTKPTPEMIVQWKQTFSEYQGRLKPNRKTGQQLIDYLKSKYALVPFHDKRADGAVSGNVLKNKHFLSKLPDGEKPHPVTFLWKHDGKVVFIGIDLTSGIYHIEDDEELFDELCAFQGLDEDDLKNFFCVSEYISALKKLGKLESVLLGFQ